MMRELTQAFPELNRDLTATEIVGACAAWVPVNASVGATIEAHRIAFQERDVSPEGRRTAGYALRAITLARTPTLDDYRQMLDYLTGLPIEAWECEVIEGHSAREIGATIS